MMAVKDGVKEVVLDTRGMEIKSVTNAADGTIYNYDISDPNPELGQPLHIHLDTPLEAYDMLHLRIKYETNENQTATSWLTREQTSSKVQPYMFT